MKIKAIAALAMAALLSITVMPMSALATNASTDSAQTVQKEHTKKKRSDAEKISEPDGAIGKDAAEAKALADAGVNEEQAGKVKVRISKLDDQTVIYKVHFIFDGKCYEYKINATNGSIVDKSTKEASEDKCMKKRSTDNSSGSGTTEKSKKDHGSGKGKKDRKTDSSGTDSSVTAADE